MIRYFAVVFFLALGAAGLGGALVTPSWMSIKLMLFGAAIACGLGIRLSLIRYFDTWNAIGAARPDEALEARLLSQYWQATTVLIGLWVVIAAITLLSLFKPSF